MKRFAVLVAVALTLSVGLSACGVKGDQEYPGSKKNVMEPSSGKKGSRDWVK